MDLALRAGHEKIILLLYRAGARASPGAAEEQLEEWKSINAIGKDLSGALREGQWPKISELLADLSVYGSTDEQLQRQLASGKLPMRFSSTPVWSAIEEKAQGATRCANEQQQRLQDLKEHITAQKTEEQRLQQAVKELQQKIAAVQQAAARATTEIEEINKSPLVGPSDRTVKFIQRVKGMEERLVAELEAQLQEDPTKLAALNGSGPKLGAVLNCFQTPETAIQALADVDGSLFLGLTSGDLDEVCKEGNVPDEARRDVAYCQELMANVQTPYNSHVDECALCGCEDPEQLIAMLQERKIELDAATLRQLNISGPRALTLSAAEFPGKRLAVAKALHAVRLIHVEVSQRLS